MGLKKIILLESHSDESKQARELLELNNLDFLAILVNSYSAEPILISNQPGYNMYNGVSEIKDYLLTS